MTLFGENYNSAEFMLGLITIEEHCAIRALTFRDKVWPTKIE